MAEGPRTGAVGVIKELGFKGLYKVSTSISRVSGGCRTCPDVQTCTAHSVASLQRCQVNVQPLGLGMYTLTTHAYTTSCYFPYTVLHLLVGGLGMFPQGYSLFSNLFYSICSHEIILG